MKGEQWYHNKCAMVAKQAVLVSETTEKAVIRMDVEANFRKDNSNPERDCTVKKVRWLSKVNPSKSTGSARTWLKNSQAAEHLLQRGTATYSACGVFVTEYVSINDQGPCYRCSTYGHMQANCRRSVRCGICSKGNSTRDRTNRDNPKCQRAQDLPRS